MSGQPTQNVSTGGVIRERLGNLGPTWVASAITAGPATLASLITAGATYGYTLLWIVVLSTVAGTFAQYLSTQLGIHADGGIVHLIKHHLGRHGSWLLVLNGVLAAGLAQLVIMKTVADVSQAVTGIDARIWGIVWAIVLAVGLAYFPSTHGLIASLGVPLPSASFLWAFVAATGISVGGTVLAAGLSPTQYAFERLRESVLVLDGGEES